MMLLLWGGLFAVVVVVLRHFTSGSLRQRNASPLGSQRGLYRWVPAEVPSIAYWISEYAKLGIDRDLDRQQRSHSLVLGVDRNSKSAPSCSTSPTPLCWTPSTKSAQPPTRPA